jgi:ParB-like nuclease domain
MNAARSEQTNYKQRSKCKQLALSPYFQKCFDMIAQTTPELTAHSFALKFPPLSDKDRAALKADIASNGQLHAIVVNEKNEILDGRHRYEIVRELGLEPRVVQLSELLGDKQVSEAEYIFAANFHRRHLSDDQRVAVLAEFLPQLRQQARANIESTLIRGRVKGSGTPIRNRHPDYIKPQKRGGVRVKLAELAGVGPGKAQRVIAIADRKPELLAEVSRGEKSLGQAYHEMTDGKPAQAQNRRSSRLKWKSSNARSVYG